MATRVAYAPVAASVLTAANLAKLPGGWIGDGTATVAQTGISTAPTDITGTSLAVTVGTGRRIKVTASTLIQQSTSVGNVTLYIREGATVLQQSLYQNVPVSGFIMTQAVVTLTPTPGAHTYAASLSTSAGTVGTSPGATNPVTFIVEDIGATP